ncbi:MAG: hypothetical protein AAFP17_10875 [Pseudomonadota bacterium]
MRRQARPKRLEAGRSTASPIAFLTIYEGDEALIEAFKVEEGLTGRGCVLITVHEAKPD